MPLLLQRRDSVCDFYHRINAFRPVSGRQVAARNRFVMATYVAGDFLRVLI
jgi:hypothetical protein